MKSKFLSTVFASLIFLVLTLSIVSVHAVTITSVNNNPDPVAPGETAIISLTIKNTLDEDVKNINIALDLSNSALPFAPFESSSERNIDKIKEDKEENFEFKIIVLPTAISGVYKIPVKIEYVIRNLTQTKTSVISVIVTAEPKITVSGDDALIQGMGRKVIIRIVNNGLSDVKFLSVEVSQPSNAIINPPLYEYLGNINSDDSDSIEYTLRPTNNDAKFITLPLTIRYKDSTNKDYVKTENVKFPVYTQKEAIERGLITKSNTGFYIGIVVILIIIYVVYRIIKRRRKKKKTI